MPGTRDDDPRPHGGDNEVVTVRDIPGKGRGLVSARKIPRGAVILREPVILIEDPGELRAIEATILGRYVMHWDGRAACLPLGLTPLINHSRKEGFRNVTTAYDHENRYIMVCARRDIEPGEELLFDYGLEDAALTQEYGIPTDD